MSTQMELPGATPAPRLETMNGKRVFTVPAKAVLNLESGFAHKLLCDGPTFSAGSACVYKCVYCYVPAIMRKSPHLDAVYKAKLKHEDVVVRRTGAAAALRAQLTDRHGAPKYKTAADRRVVYASPLVDVAGNLELVRETIECCRLILELTNWQIRLLSKSNLLPRIAEALEEYRGRLIFGVSTGTLDDSLAASIEVGTAKVSKRIQSLHWLQDNGFRTFGMICPSLPQQDYGAFARDMAAAIRGDRCEHVWAEIENSRGDSMKQTISALRGAGYDFEGMALETVASDRGCWEHYARETFEAHVAVLPAGKLRFLQYVTAASKDWWQGRAKDGAVLL